MRLNRSLLPIAALASALVLGACAEEKMMADQTAVVVGGAPMLATRTIVANAAESADHTTLVAAVQAAGLVDTLSGDGPFTVFAPTNAAFAALPEGTVDTLLLPENKGALTEVLTYHVVPGTVTAPELLALIAAGGGTAELATANGGVLRAQTNGESVVIIDQKGRVATVTTADALQSNGVIHVVDTVLLP